MFYDRDNSKLRYLLLYGAGSYDNRNVEGRGGDNLVTYECESLLEAQESTTNYASDLYFAMLDDKYQHPSILCCTHTYFSRTHPGQ